MHPVLEIWRGLLRAVRRDLGTYRSLKVNNLFLLIVLMVGAAAQSGVEPKAAELPILLLCLLLLFPLSSDPLAIVPPSRLLLWPLNRRQRFALRLSSFALSPVLWLGVLTLILTARPRILAVFASMAAAVMILKLVLPSPRFPRFVPPIPGRLGGLVRLNIRELLATLDPYLAAIFACGGATYLMFSVSPDPRAASVLAMLAGLTLSTNAQCLFGLDVATSAMTRYRMLPLRGWEILLTKDLAFLALAAVVSIPLHPLTGAAFAFTALAIGHHPSVVLRQPIHRWRFTGSRLFPGVVQAIVSMMIGLAAAQSAAALWAAAALWVLSLFIYGRYLDRRVLSPKSA